MRWFVPPPLRTAYFAKPHSGHGLPRVADDEPSARGVDARAGARRDAAEVLDQVERQSFAREQRARRALERRQRLAGHGAVTVLRAQRDDDVAELLEDQLEEREAADDERFLGREAAARAGGRGDERLGGAVAVAEVLLEGELEEGGDQGLVEDGVSCRGRHTCRSNSRGLFRGQRADA